jgi:hypothetical protein
VLRDESVTDRLVSGQAADEGNSLRYAVEAGDVAFVMRNVGVEILESSPSDILNVTPPIGVITSLSHSSDGCPTMMGRCSSRPIH